MYVSAQAELLLHKIAACQVITFAIQMGFNYNRCLMGKGRTKNKKIGKPSVVRAKCMATANTNTSAIQHIEYIFVTDTRFLIIISCFYYMWDALFVPLAYISFWIFSRIFGIQIFEILFKKLNTSITLLTYGNPL